MVFLEKQYSASKTARMCKRGLTIYWRCVCRSIVYEEYQPDRCEESKSRTDASLCRGWSELEPGKDANQSYERDPLVKACLVDGIHGVDPEGSSQAAEPTANSPIVAGPPQPRGISRLVDFEGPHTVCFRGSAPSAYRIRDIIHYKPANPEVMPEF